MTMKPDYETAAVRALETLIGHHITYAPIDPLPILNATPGVLTFSYAEISDTIGLDRSCILSGMNPEGRAASTAVEQHNGHLHYIVAYNQRLPTYATHRALARELGHIVLGHDGTRPEEVRNEEATAFARHLLFPRPLIKAMTDAGIHVTTELLGNVTGCYERCQECIRKSPGIHVPKDLNRTVRELFADYVENLLSVQSVIAPKDHSVPADFGTYMDGYEE